MNGCFNLLMDLSEKRKMFFVAISSNKHAFFEKFIFLVRRKNHDNKLK